MALFAAGWYGWPSEKLIVIGVTGTKGKSTTANIIAQLLESAGQVVGLTSTATMKVGPTEWLSQTGMTMPGRFALQRMLRDMHRAGCTYAVIETSSEGIAQYRHSGIHYDCVLLTNLFPEHLESHGSYEAYRAAKGKLFQHLHRSRPKKINGRTISQHTVLNADDKEFSFYRELAAGTFWSFGVGNGQELTDEHRLSYRTMSLDAKGATILLGGQMAQSPFLFGFNVENVAAAALVCLAFGFSWPSIVTGIAALKPVPGRQEFIQCGQPFLVMIDYTHEPTSMRALYRHLAVLSHKRVLQIIGPTGGGRDRWRRPVMGEVAAAHADVVISTTDDPYDDDPAVLADELLAGAVKVQQQGRSVVLEKIVDRRAAIARAFALAAPGDLVLISGRGAEQTMAVANGVRLQWDDRVVASEELGKLGYRA
ncbi:MAG: UDP-N-acetylmuramyl-tripeptide synthetase [Patescibacteria group bacterium]|jgi:UDP-N-acetylmuramoyl-L-alanyl-D-glutamate--2,6-diaminopimelate ligase